MIDKADESRLSVHVCVVEWCLARDVQSASSLTGHDGHCHTLIVSFSIRNLRLCPWPEGQMKVRSGQCRLRALHHLFSTSWSARLYDHQIM